MSNATYRVYTEGLGSTDASSFVGNKGELFYDPDTTVLRLSDGATPGGVQVAPSENSIANITELAPGAPSGATAYNGVNGTRYFVHTAGPTGAWTANFTNLGLLTNEATRVRIITPSVANDYNLTPSQVDGTAVGVTNVTGNLKASKNKTNIFDIDVVKTGASTYSIYGQVTSI